jgi:hypothetical protein
VFTRKQQNLRLQFADESELLILENSEVVLDKLSFHKKTGMVDTRIRLNIGGVNTWVRKQSPDSLYQIQTPAAITAVRGTSFRVTSDENQVSRTEVTEGTVVVVAGGTEIEVKDGFGVVAEINKPVAEPVRLLTAPEVYGQQIEGQQAAIFNWTEVEGASYYRYQMATDEDFNHIIVDETAKQNRVEFDNMQAGNYYLQVRGVDRYELEGGNAINAIEIRALPVEEPESSMFEDDSYWKVIMLIGALIVIL